MAGPVVLILVGVIFLLGNMGYLSWVTLHHLFARYWPALIIVWGVIKLVEYYQAKNEGATPSGIGVGGFFMLFFLICFGLAATKSEQVNWRALGEQIDIDEGDFPVFGNSYSYSDQIEQALPANAELHVASDRGSVIVHPSDQNTIRVVVQKKINASTEGEARKVDAATKPIITTAGSVVSLNANTQGGGDKSVRSDLEIFIPRKATIDVAARRGDVRVSDRDAGVHVSSHHSEVVVENVNGSVQLTIEGSSVRISKITGDVAVDGRVNETSIADIKGTVRLTGDFMEAVKLANITKTVSFKSSRTDMEFARLDGSLDLDSGDLNASQVVGPLRLITRSKDIHIDSLTGDARVEDTNGEVELHEQTGPVGVIDIRNRKGDINVVLPNNAGFSVDATSHRGEIHSDFSELKVDNRDRESKASGSVGSGGPRVLLDSEYGTIQIRKAG